MIPTPAELETEYYKTAVLWSATCKSKPSTPTPDEDADEPSGSGHGLVIIPYLKKMNRRMNKTFKEINTKLTNLDSRLSAVEKNIPDKKALVNQVVIKLRSYSSFQFDLERHRMEKELRAELGLKEKAGKSPEPVVDFEEFEQKLKDEAGDDHGGDDHGGEAGDDHGDDLMTQGHAEVGSIHDEANMANEANMQLVLVHSEIKPIAEAQPDNPLTVRPKSDITRNDDPPAPIRTEDPTNDPPAPIPIRTSQRAKRLAPVSKSPFTNPEPKKKKAKKVTDVEIEAPLPKPWPTLHGTLILIRPSKDSWSQSATKGKILPDSLEFNCV